MHEGASVDRAGHRAKDRREHERREGSVLGSSLLSCGVASESRRPEADMPTRASLPGTAHSPPRAAKKAEQLMRYSVAPIVTKGNPLLAPVSLALRLSGDRRSWA